MLQVKSQEKSPTILHGDTALEWYEITGRELKIATRQNGTIHDINLELKQDGRKTPTILLTLASIKIAEEVIAKYEDDPLLEETLVNFAMERYKGSIDRISRLFNLTYETRRMIDLTSVKTIEVAFTVSVERDDQDQVTGEAIVATVGEQTFIYSSAGVFDLGV